ncbi:MAG: phenylalanine--tRNA ligase subunit beta [Myxococcales bacterium]|nr:phenylalanine--tRNA ligase subunit beta [Myxococcales bacterium]
MRASHRWLEELVGAELDPGEVAVRLTGAGIEVEDQQSVGEGLEGVVVAEVRGRRPHPAREKLQLVTVFDGAGESEVVCGASNVPEAGGRVLLAQLGAKLPGGFEIAERKLGGVVSRGMICSEVELGIGADEGGIVVLGDDVQAAPGTKVAEALGLYDVIYELGLTPNRPDCLGHVGLARELCALLGHDFRWPALQPVPALLAPGELLPQEQALFSLGLEAQASVQGGAHGFAPVRVEIDEPERCPRYGAALVADVTVAPSPFWIRQRLFALGMRPINNVVDATNLILLGFGHPIHAFDYDRVQGSQIRVRLAAEGECMTTLDGEERRLRGDDLLICDGERPVALAGVMGGENSEIGDETRRVLIECAYFDPRSIRRTAKRLGMHSESSHRFERGVDPGAVPRVLSASAALIASLAGGSVVEQGLDMHPRPQSPRRVQLRSERLERLLGTKIDTPEAKRRLEALGCSVSVEGEGPAQQLAVEVPSHRPDLGLEVDLIEEVARLGGYDAIPTELPSIRPSEAGTSESIRFVERLRDAAAAAGLSEAINYSFLSDRELSDAAAPAASVRLRNPLSEERSVMRTSLLPGLLSNLGRAQRQQVQRFAQFELGRVFVGSVEEAGQRLPAERHELGVLLWGARDAWFAEGEVADFYDAKAVIEAIVRRVAGLPIDTVLDSELEAERALHPRRRARIQVGGAAVGVLGELHPGVVEAFELGGRPIYARIEVPALAAQLSASGPARARELPRFPAATRDLAVVVDEAAAAGEVGAALREAAGELAESVVLFDMYRGDQVPDGKKSLAFHVTYRDAAATLTDKKVDKVHAKVMQAAEKRFGASVRR